jgi:hypothetical protein
MIPAQGLTDGFALKLNASGDFVWIKILGGCQNEDYGTCITLDGAGNVYTTGVFRYIGDFDPGSGVYELHAQGGTDVFISKLTSSGNFVWAKYLGGGADDYSYAIAIDASGDLYTTGSFQAWSDFDPGPGSTVFTTAGGYDIFVQKMSQSLQTPILSLVANEYCNVIGIQTFKLLNLPDTPGVSISIKLDATILSLAADSSFSISINNLSPGSHQIEVKYSNATEVKTTTKDFTVIVAQTPDVNVTASATTVADLTPVTVTAINVSGGGTMPLFTFAKDKNINILWQAESANNVLVLDPSNLAIGQNRIYVRMKTSVSCYTVSANIDSVDITRTVTTGIRDIDYPNQEISVYPIPFNQSFEIKGLQISKSYLIFLSNPIGQKIFEKNIHNNTNIKITWLVPAGNYWLTIYDKTKMRLLGAIPLIKN